MIQPSEPRTIGPQESTVVGERITADSDPIPAQARLDYGEQTEQVSHRTAGLEQHDQVVTDAAGLQHRERTVRDVGAEQRLNLHTVSQVMVLFLGIVEGLIGLRVILKLIGANPEVEFAGFIYNAAGIFLAPFFGLVGSPAAGDSVFEVPSLIAMLFYALLGWLIIGVVWPMFVRPTTTSTSTYDRHER